MLKLFFALMLLCSCIFCRETCSESPFEKMVESARDIAVEMRTTGSLTVNDNYEARIVPGEGPKNYAGEILEQWLLDASATKREMIYLDAPERGFFRAGPDEAIVQNSDYQFKLERKKSKEQQDWAILSLNIFGESVATGSIHRNINSENGLPVVKIPVLAGEYINLDQLRIGENCELLSQDGLNFVVTVEVDTQASLEDPLRLEIEIDENHGLPVQYRETFNAADRQLRIDTNCIWDFEDGKIKKAEFERTTSEVKDTEKILGRVKRTTVFNNDKLDVSDFRLTAYGLPEPALPEKAYGWLPLFIVAAIVLAIGAVVFRSYRSRA